MKNRKYWITRSCSRLCAEKAIGSIQRSESESSLSSIRIGSDSKRNVSVDESNNACSDGSRKKGKINKSSVSEQEVRKY